ncbi:MAG: C4-dicarboxylate ABC transporter, partial [Paracoccaceae bacterium]|nr:C4-dicarboxylate ABC transporter [Paracoccaceae bacterium]
MSDTSDIEVEVDAPPNRAVYILALIFVFMGIVNSTPLIPGWDDMWRSLSGIEDLKTRSFKTEWFYPIAFFFMMLVVALKHSMWREWRGTSR